MTSLVAVDMYVLFHPLVRIFDPCHPLPPPPPANDAVQQHQDTGNSCKSVGYDEFDPPSWPGACSPNKEDWISTDLSLCGTGKTYPEEFWACSDIALSRGE